MKIITDAEAQEHRDRPGPQSVFEADLLHTREWLKQMFGEIWTHGGRVCSSYEICTHASCQSSHHAWALADVALRVLETGLEESV
jgi:hypothetical protein